MILRFLGLLLPAINSKTNQTCPTISNPASTRFSFAWLCEFVLPSFRNSPPALSGQSFKAPSPMAHSGTPGAWPS